MPANACEASTRNAWGSEEGNEGCWEEIGGREGGMGSSYLECGDSGPYLLGGRAQQLEGMKQLLQLAIAGK